MMTNLNQGIEDRNRERKNCELVTAEKVNEGDCLMTTKDLILKVYAKKFYRNICLEDFQR